MASAGEYGSNAAPGLHALRQWCHEKLQLQRQRKAVDRSHKRRQDLPITRKDGIGPVVEILVELSEEKPASVSCRQPDGLAAYQGRPEQRDEGAPVEPVQFGDVAVEGRRLRRDRGEWETDLLREWKEVAVRHQRGQEGVAIRAVTEATVQ